LKDGHEIFANGSSFNASNKAFSALSNIRDNVEGEIPNFNASEVP